MSRIQGEGSVSGLHWSVVILSGGEAGVRDPTSEASFDDVDGSEYAACCVDVLSTASVRMMS